MGITKYLIETKYFRISYYYNRIFTKFGHLGISLDSYKDVGGPFDIDIYLVFITVTFSFGKDFESDYTSIKDKQ